MFPQIAFHLKVFPPVYELPLNNVLSQFRFGTHLLRVLLNFSIYLSIFLLGFGDPRL